MNVSSLPIIRSTPQKTLRSFASRFTCIHSAKKSSPLAPHASSLPFFFSPSTKTGATTCIVPSLSLQVSNSNRIYTESKTERKHEAAHRLRTPMLLAGSGRTELAPTILLRNLSFSFRWMLNKRLQSTSQALCNHSLRTRDFTLKSKVGELVSRLTSSRKLISLSSASISFSTLPIVGEQNSNISCQERIVLPLFFQGHFKIVIMGRHEVKVRVEAPGTITGHFDGHSNFLENVKIDVNTVVLLEKMLGHCREVARKTCSIVAAVVSRKIREKRIRQKMTPPVRTGDEMIAPHPPPRPCKKPASHSEQSRPILSCASPSLCISNKEINNLVCEVKHRRTESLTAAGALILLMQ